MGDLGEFFASIFGSGGSTADSVGNAAMIAQIGGGVASTIGAYNKAKADKAAYDYQAQISENNATLAEIAARSAMDRGATAEGRSRLKTAALEGAQRARLAANGVDINQGSAMSILLDTDYIGDQDALAIRDNTAGEVYGHRTSAANSRDNARLLRGRADAENPSRAAISAGLGAFGTVASGWYSRRKAGLGVQVA